jgi:uncharacterized protein
MPGPDNEGVLDAHCHVGSSRFIPRSFIEGAARNVYELRRALGMPGTLTAMIDAELELMQDHWADGLIGEMDAAGIREACLLVPDFTYALRDSELTVSEMFDQHAAIAKRHPGRFRILGGVDPRWGRTGVDLFERSLATLGFAGLKLYPPCGYSPDDRMLDEYYEICAAYDVPVLCHMGPTSSVLSFRSAHPAYIDEPARRFPLVRFILAHAATAYPSECAAMAAFRPNVYADISGFVGEGGPGRRALSYLFEAGIAHKLLFGTDWPVFQRSTSQRQCVEEFRLAAEEHLPKRHVQLISRENALRVFNRARPTLLAEPMPIASPSNMEAGH